MLDVSVIGIGNCGSQIAALAMKKLNIPVLAINSSERDLQTLPSDVPNFMIGDAKGAGKERAAAKEMLKSSIMTILNMISIRMFSPLMWSSLSVPLAAAQDPVPAF